MDSRIGDIFSESAKTILQQMAGLELSLSAPEKVEGQEILSLGVASIISFSGPSHRGRLLFDLEPSAALHLVKEVTGEAFAHVKEFMVLASISEINNILAGHATTQINNLCGAGVRLAPPFVFCGSDTIVSIPKIPSVFTEAATPYGRIRLSIAFEGGI